MGQPETLLDIGDREIRIQRSSRPYRCGQQQGEALLVAVERLPIGKGLRPFGDIEAGIINVHEQVDRGDTKSSGNTDKFIRPRDHFTAFYLGQSNVGNFGQNRREAQQFQKTGRAALLPQSVGKHDIAKWIDPYLGQIAPTGFCIVVG
ncbi:MAG: hypothetical protein ACRCS5_15095 [Sphingomonas sp.]|uniref:hypothetical protein n=1 Tax=Sphingomonas sp. TaxID=28214 RepID=UPI0030FADB24